MKNIYLDNSATTKAYDRVIDFVSQTMKENYGNPSSLHKMGVDSEKNIKIARKQIADYLRVNTEEIYFTSGGTESNNTAILGGVNLKKRQGNKIITSKIEHPSVLEVFKKLRDDGFEVTFIDVDKSGRVNMEQLSKEINDETILISIMHVNNEIGTLQSVNEIGNMKRNAIFHTDMVQSFGKEDIDMTKVDLASFSSHKIHGPMGVGGLYIRNGANISPLLVGGGQEKNKRSGTENVEGICGFGLATKIITEDRIKKQNKIKKLKLALQEKLLSNLEDIKINTPEESCSSILNVSFKKVRAEVVLHMLEENGIYASTGSACSSNKKEKSHVLSAIGLDENMIDGTLRFSLNEFTTQEDINFTGEKTIEVVNRFRKLGSFR